MEDKNQLSDLMLDKKNTPSKNNKKMILAVATLGVILIIVVLLMNSLNSDNENNLPQSPLPPKPIVQKQQPQTEVEEPMFEDAEVIDEGTLKEQDVETEKLQKISQELKAQSNQALVEKPVKKVQKTTTPKPVVHKTQPKPVTKKVVHSKPKQTTKHVATGRYYVQVGSFSKYSPDKKFLNSIKKAGYDYKFHKATVHGKKITKLLIGPYPSRSAAKKALRNIKRTLQKGAFIVKI